jgi:HTH-type transcriptional regulator/antitoxin MqsA
MNREEKCQCPICGYGNLQKKVITETFEYKGKSFDYPNYVIYQCPSCDEAIVDKQSMKESGRAIRDFYRKVDGLLTAKEIRRIRESKLCLTQDDASMLLGGGKKSFARYENSEVIQSTALDNLLRILDDDPSRLAVILSKNKTQEESIVIPLPVKYSFTEQTGEAYISQDEEDYDTDIKVACYG